MPALLIPLGVVLLAAFALSSAIAAVEQERARDAAKADDRFNIVSALSGVFGVFGILTRKAQLKFSEIVSRFAGAKLAALAAWFTSLGVLVHGLERGIESFAAATADAVGRIVTDIIPHEIAAAVKPVGITARQALRLARSGRTLANRALHEALAAEAAAKAGLIRVGRRVGEVQRTLDALRRLARGIEGRVGRLTHRLTKVEKAVGIAALTGVVVKVLARRFPWLFCRRVNAIGKRACGLDADLMESLLADVLVVAGAVSVVEFVRDMQAVEKTAFDIMGAIIREL